jgi:hypothetical protein
VRFDEPFDAVVCRLLLFHLPDAVDVMRHHREACLRPGGKVVAIDYDTSAVRSVPPVPLLAQMNDWVEAAFRAAGADSRVGARLVPILREAGFADVAGFGIQAYFARGDRPGVAMLAAVVRAMHDVIVRNGIAGEKEVDIDTVGERLQRAVDAADAVVLPPTVVGAWGRA